MLLHRLLRPTYRFFSTSYPAHEVVGLPALSPTMTHGNLTTWKMKIGDAIGAGDIICEIETDKAVVDFEAQDEAFLAKILVPEGTADIPVGQPIMVLVEDEADIPAFADFQIKEEQVEEQDTSSEPEPVVSVVSAAPVVQKTPPRSISTPLKKSSFLTKSFQKRQEEYMKQYGSTGMSI